MSRFVDPLDHRPNQVSNVAQLLRYEVVPADENTDESDDKFKVGGDREAGSANLNCNESLSEISFPGQCVVLLLMEYADSGNLATYLQKLRQLRQGQMVTKSASVSSVLSLDEIEHVFSQIATAVR